MIPVQKVFKADAVISSSQAALHVSHTIINNLMSHRRNTTKKTECGQGQYQCSLTEREREGILHVSLENSE